LMYPEGDKSVPASGRLPKGGFYFDTIVRQPPIDEGSLNVEDNLEEFGPISDADLQYLQREAERLYAGTATRRDYVYRIFERQCEIGLQNLERIRQVVGNKVVAVFVTGTDFGSQ